MRPAVAEPFSASACGARVTLRDNSGCDVLASGEQKESRQPGSADGVTNAILRGSIAEMTLQRKVVSCPRGSSRNRVTTRASQTTVRVAQSKRDLETPSTRQTPIFRVSGFCLGNGHVVDSCRPRCLCSLSYQRSVPTSRNRDVLPLNGVGSYNRMSIAKKTGEADRPVCRKRGTSTLSVGLRSIVNRILCSRMEFSGSVADSLEKSS
jgi:hypothetical protein